MDKIAAAIGAVVLVFALIFLVSLLCAYPTKWLWNWLMPELFNLKTIDVFQAWGLNALTGLLFKSTYKKE